MERFDRVRLPGIRFLISRLGEDEGPFILGTGERPSNGAVSVSRKPLFDGSRRVFGACLLVLLFFSSGIINPALAQANFDRPGSDYLRSPVPSGDPADCAMVCERDRRCRAWSFNYPTDFVSSAVCWLKNGVPPRTQSNCCVTGVRGAGVIEPRNSAIEASTDRFGGDYRNFEIAAGDGDDACKAACVADKQCRAWTYARAGYAGRDARCFMKKDIKPPRRKPGFISGVVR